MLLRGVKRRWLTLLRHIRCRNGSSSDGWRSKGWKTGRCWERSTEKAVEKVSQSGGGRGGSRRAACQKPAQWNWAGKQTLIWRRCSLTAAATGTRILPAGNTHNYLSAHRNQNPFSRKGQMRALLQSALDSSSAGRAIRSISWKIIIEAPWILSRIKAKPQFM